MPSRDGGASWGAVMSVKKTMHWTLAVLLMTTAAPTAASAADYPWLSGRKPARTMDQAIGPPAGFHRIVLRGNGFGEWLRELPLLPAGSPVLLWNGQPKSEVWQHNHAAVVDLDVGHENLQQCADAVMRLRAEYLWAAGRQRDIAFQAGGDKALTWKGGDRKAFARFLRLVFAGLGTSAMSHELPRPAKGTALQPGDVVVQGPAHGHSYGHAVLVLDAAEDAKGERIVLIGQSYMPAQQFHVLNHGDARLSPWFKASALDSAAGLKTPSWPAAFTRKDVRSYEASRAP